MSKFHKSTKKILLFLGILSLVFWLAVVAYFVLQPGPEYCSYGDSLCLAGGTFWGSVAWGTGLAIFALPSLWAVALLGIAIVVFIKKWLNKSPKTSSTYRRKKLVIIAASALTGLGVLLWIVLSSTQNTPRPAPTLSLHKNPDAQAATYNDVPIIEACNVVSLEELGAKGIALRGDTYPKAFFRTYLEGAKGPMPLSDGLDIGDKPNSCHYSLQNEGDLFDIAVYHPSYSKMYVLEGEISMEYNAQPDIDGLKVYKAKTYHNTNKDFFHSLNTNEGNEDFILQKGDTALWFRLRKFKQPTREAMLHLIAANFSKLLQNPEARVTVDYRDSPLQGKLYRVCELLTAENAGLLLGQNMSPVVKEGYGGAPGTRNYITSSGKPNGYMYVAQECERSGSNEKVSYTHLNLELRQYATEEGAKHFLQGAAAGDNDRPRTWQAIGRDLGDEAYIETSDIDEVPSGDTIHVRKGPLVLTFSYELGDYGTPSAETSIRRLEPVITEVLERIE